MGAWYWIGVSVGLGAAAGVLVAGFARRGSSSLRSSSRLRPASASAIAIDAWQPGGWGDSSAARVGGLAGALGAAQIVRGALRRGGTAAARRRSSPAPRSSRPALAWIPAVGYLEALALPAARRAPPPPRARALRRAAHAREVTARSSSSSSSTG